MDIHLKIIGILFITLGSIHCIFPSYFKWKQELASLSTINRQMMHIHTLFIAVAVILMGLLALFFSNDLINTQLGKVISIGLGIFWSLRLFIQFFGYSKSLWKGKKFETFVHILFTLFFLYVSTVFISISILH